MSDEQQGQEWTQPNVAEYSAIEHEIEEPSVIRGGTRTFHDGLNGFVTVGDDEGRHTLFSKDRAGLAAALRRAADEIEDVSPFDLPPVDDVCMYCHKQRNGADWSGEPFCSNECTKAAIDTHRRIYGRPPV